MTAPTCDELCEEIGVKVVSQHSDNSWRHGTRETVVFYREADGTYWQAHYCLSTDGETNELAQGMAQIVQVEPYEKMVTSYRKVGSVK